MRKRRAYPIIPVCFILIICLTGVINASFALGYAPGVKVGDTATYSYTITVPQMMTGFTILITGVSGDVVYFNYTTLLSNGTSMTSQFSQNFSRPLVYYDLMIPANVGNGVPIEGVVTNGSIVTLWAAGSPRTCVRSYTSGQLPNPGGGTYTGYTDYYWDQATGVTVKGGYREVVWYGGQWTVVETTWEMTSTNMWVGADLTPLLIVGGIAALAVAAVGVVYWRVRKYHGIGVAEPTFNRPKKR